MQAFRILEPQKAELREVPVRELLRFDPAAPAVRQSSVVASTSPDPRGTGNRKRTAGQCHLWLIGGGLAQ
jgi:hypothetical protein